MAQDVRKCWGIFICHYDSFFIVWHFSVGIGHTISIILVRFLAPARTNIKRWKNKHVLRVIHMLRMYILYPVVILGGSAWEGMMGVRHGRPTHPECPI